MSEDIKEEILEDVQEEEVQTPEEAEEMTEEERILQIFPNYDPERHSVLFSDGKIVGLKHLIPEEIETFQITRGAFWKRLTLEKLTMLKTLAKENVLIEAQLQMLADSEFIDLRDPDLKEGLDLYISQELLTQEDKERILAPARKEEIPNGFQ